MWRPDGWKNPYRDRYYKEKFESGADAMYEPAYRKGQRDLIERYKWGNPSSYKKYQAYWDNLLEEAKE